MIHKMSNRVICLPTRSQNPRTNRLTVRYSARAAGEVHALHSMQWLLFLNSLGSIRN